MRRAPQDEKAIRDLTHTIRTLSRFRLLDPAGGLGDNWLNILRDLPLFPALRKLGQVSGREYGKRFADPLLRSFFSEGDIGRLSAVAMVISLAWMHAGNAGYCVGGAQAIIRAIEERIRELGGEVRLRARVRRILVENDAAVGVELAGGEKVMADWVISGRRRTRDGFRAAGRQIRERRHAETLRRAGNVRVLRSGFAGRGDGPERAAADADADAGYTHHPGPR